MVENKVAHLGFVQAIVTRMATNSFLVKGWCVTLVAAVFVLSTEGTNKKFVLIAYFPIIMFWILDAYFLRQEKLYRVLYSEIANDNISSDRFILETSVCEQMAPSSGELIISKVILPFYAIMLAMVLAVMYVF